jgi:16S rRNA (guanine966-N2)-methyltransferase
MNEEVEAHFPRSSTDTMPKQRRHASGPSGKLRIVAGSLRGSRLAVPDVPGLRPTADRVRETLFNWLAPVIEGARCLDLFAGTGALGIEALSRGAAECVFVERDRTLSRMLRENLARLKQESVRLIEGDALGALAATAQAFDIVFLDPPFTESLWEESAQRLERGWLHEGSWIYLESPVERAFVLPPNWQLHREGQAGAVRFALYRRAAADPLS